MRVWHARKRLRWRSWRPVAAATALTLVAATAVALPPSPRAAAAPVKGDISQIGPMGGEAGSAVTPEFPTGDFGRPAGPPAGERTEVAAEPTPRQEAPARKRLGRKLIDRTPTSDTYLNPDGTKTTALHQQVVNVKDRVTGQWRRIDNSLRREGGVVKPKVATASIELPDQSGGGEAIEVASPDESTAVRLIPEGLADVPVSIEGKKAVYREVQPGVDMELVTNDRGVKNNFVLHRPVDEPEWTFRLQLGDGLTPEALPDGGVLVRDAEGEVTFQIPAPRAWDNHFDDRAGEYREGPATQRLVRDEHGWKVVLAADAAWIAAEEREFPVKVDPGANYVSGRGADTFVSDAFPNNNYNIYPNDASGLDAYINKIGYYPGAGTNWSLVYWDITPVQGKQILGAWYNVHWAWSYSPNATRYRLYPVTSGWDGRTVTWNSRPSINWSSYLDGSGVRYTWSQSNITSWMQNWIEGRWFWGGMMIDTAGEGQNSWKKFIAAENGDGNGAPVIEVAWNDRPGVNNPAPGNGSTPHENGVTLTTDVWDNNSDKLQTQFLVSHSADVANTYFASTEFNQQPGRITWTTPKLEWNRKHYWQVRTSDGYSGWQYSAVQSFTPTNQGPPTPAPSSPQDRQVVIDKRPTLSTAPVTDPDGDAVQYEFQIATGPDGQSGLVARSGFIDATSWQVPAGVLKDGVNYTWTVRSRDRDPDARSLFAPVRNLKVDLRLGVHNAIAGDQHGPFTTNLATGNVITTLETPTMDTVGGELGVKFTYNSLSVDEAGLTGAYFTGDDTTGIKDTETPALVRTDPQISFNWGDTGSPYPPVIAGDGFRVRWKGFVRVPATGSYLFGGVHDDGMRVRVNNTQVYDKWSEHMAPTDAPRFGTAVTLEAGKYYPIQVDFREWVYGTHVKLFAKKDADAPVEVPSSWFSVHSPVLPPGWSMSVDAGGIGLGYTKATITDTTAVLTDGTGASHSYTKLSDTSYAPPAGETGVLSRDAEGRLTLVDSSGTISVFSKTGDLESVTAANDAKKPAAARMTWTPVDAANPIPRLTEITDPVSGRKLTLHYAGSSECRVWDQTPASAVPAGHLCAVKQPDGATTYLVYHNGKLKRYSNPGNEHTDFAFHASDLLAAMRPPLSLDWIVADIANRNHGGPNWEVHYDGQRRATKVISASETGSDSDGGRRRVHAYTWGANHTTVNVVGVTTGTGWLRKVERDGAGRTVYDIDATGKAHGYTWGEDDRQLQVVDNNGRATTTHYDVNGNPVETYGPAPAHCFGADRRPKAPAPDVHCAVIPHMTTKYDEGMTGMSGVWWTNADFQGAVHTYSTAVPNANWSTTPPAQGLDPRGGYSGRMSGKLRVDQAGTYYFGTGEDDALEGVRFFIDDNQVLNRMYSAEVLRDKPIGYWRLSETDGAARDVSGHGWPGAYVGALTRGKPGFSADDNNRAADFAGGYVEIADQPGLTPAGALTIELWAKLRHNTGNGYHDLVSTHDGNEAGNRPFEFAVSPEGRLELRQVGPQGGMQIVKSTQFTPFGQWAHLAVTRDAAGKVVFYVNGKKAGDGTFTSPAGDNAGPLTIARRTGTLGNTSAGEIDEVALYDKALDEKAITTHLSGAGRVGQGRLAVPLTAGSHKVRIDYVHRAPSGDQTYAGGSGVHFTWHQEGQPWAMPPAGAVTPDYGLVTGNSVDDSTGVPTQQVATSYAESGNDVAFGMAGRTTADPGGLGLTTRTAYETAGEGYLRKTSRTMPTGATTTYTYYGDTETRANPCDPSSPAVVQSGLPKGLTAPTPATGPARTEEQVYDLRGRLVADLVSGAGWACTYYDDRDRVVRKTFPGNATDGEREVRFDHAVGGDPLTNSVSDRNGTVTTKVDLLGRTLWTTDVHGVKTELTYDLAGQVTSEKVSFPNPLDAPQVMTYTYDDAGRTLTQKLGDTTLATMTHDGSGELATVTYANGSKLARVVRSPAGKVLQLVWRTADGREVVSGVTRSQSGLVVDETQGGVDANPSGPNYVYDTVGRLVQAWTGGHHYTYDYTSEADAACPTGTQANAGRNTNRVKLTDVSAAGTAVTGYCYDAADRILKTHGATSLEFAYDESGNTTEIKEGANSTYIGWDTAGRNIGARVTGAQAANVAWVRDATDRIVKRTVLSGEGDVSSLLGYTGAGDTADVSLSAVDGRLLSRSVVLPGGVLHTVRGGDGAAQPTWDHPTVRGNLFLTTGPDGNQLGGLREYNPFGEPMSGGAVAPDAVPDNLPGDADYGWLGQHQRLYEHAGALALVQMGVRPYLPGIGRFLSVDPVEGGSANDYDYVNGDPINVLDLDGRGIGDWLKRNARNIVKGAVVVASIGAAVACGATVVCGIAVGAAVGAAWYTADKAGNGFTGSGLLKSTVLGAVTGGLGGGALAGRVPIMNAMSKVRGKLADGASKGVNKVREGARNVRSNVTSKSAWSQSLAHCSAKFGMKVNKGGVTGGQSNGGLLPDHIAFILKLIPFVGCMFGQMAR